jgi:hypothetical protein
MWKFFHIQRHKISNIRSHFNTCRIMEYLIISKIFLKKSWTTRFSVWLNVNFHRVIKRKLQRDNA